MEKGEIQTSRLFLSDQFSCIGADPFLLQWLKDYSKRKAQPLHLEQGSSFQRAVMCAMGQIPFGKTVSYAELANLSGHPKAARAVGTVCKKNPFPLFIPCHRIIQANGKMGRFAYGEEIKRRLLEFETEDK